MLRGNLQRISRAATASALSKAGSTCAISSGKFPIRGFPTVHKSYNASLMTRITRLSTSESPKSDDKTASNAAADRQDIDRFDPDNFDDYQEPKTAGQQVFPERYCLQNMLDNYKRFSALSRWGRK